MLKPYLRAIDAERIYTNFGPLSSLFSNRLAAHLGLPPFSVVPTSSGTSAICGALLTVRGQVCRRKLAAVPSLTFVATGAAAQRCGFELLIVDVNVLLDCPGDTAHRVQRALAEAAVGTRFWYGHGLWTHPHFADSSRDPTPVADDLGRRLLGLPSSHDLEPAEIDRIVAVSQKAIGALAPFTA